MKSASISKTVYEQIMRGEEKFLSDGMGFYQSERPRPVRVIYSDPATIVFWSDGSKSVAKCDEDDTYDKAIGLFMAICKRYIGGGPEYEDFLRFVCRELYTMDD